MLVTTNTTITLELHPAERLILLNMLAGEADGLAEIQKSLRWSSTLTLDVARARSLKEFVQNSRPGWPAAQQRLASELFEALPPFSVLQHLSTDSAPTPPAVYTEEQVTIALGIMSGRIDPETELKYFDDAKKLHPEITSACGWRTGNPGPRAHRLKAEEILKHLILKGKHQ